MGAYYGQKQKQNPKKKQFKEKANLFDRELNFSVVNALIDEYFYGVAKQFCRLQGLIFSGVRHELTSQNLKTTSEFSEQSTMENKNAMAVWNQECSYPVELSKEDSRMIDLGKRRINHALANCFVGTVSEKAIGQTLWAVKCE